MTSHHDITLFTVFKAVWDETDERKCAESFTSTVKDDFIWIWCNQTLQRVHAHTRVWVWSSLKERRVPEAYIYASDKRRLASPHLTNDSSLRIKATHQGQKIGILSFISALLSINYTKSLLPGCRALCVKVGGWTDCWQTDRVEGDRVRGLINQLSAISLPAIGYQLHSGRGWK